MTDRISQRVSSLFLLILTVFISNMADSPAIGAGIEGSDIGAFSFVPPPLDHKVRKRLKERFFGGLPENPEMSDFDLQELKNVIKLPLHHLGSEDEGLVLDSFNEYLPEAEALDLYGAHIENLEPLDGHPKLRVLHLKKAKFNRKDIFTKDDGNGELVPISLPKLEELSLEETDFRDLRQLQHFTGLKHLRLNNNGLNSEKGDLIGLEDLIDLDKFLNIDDTNLYNFYNGFDTDFEIEKNNISLLFKSFKY